MTRYRHAIYLLLLLVLGLLSGCGNGAESGPTPTTKVIFSSGAAVVLEQTGNGSYSVKGENFNKVGGIQINLVYDTAHMNSPQLAYGDLLASAMAVNNVANAGVIRFAAVNTSAPVNSGISGSGQLFTISFTNDDGFTTPSIDTVKMIDTSGKQIM